MAKVLILCGLPKLTGTVELTGHRMRAERSVQWHYKIAQPVSRTETVHVLVF